MTDPFSVYQHHVMGIDEAGRGCVIGPLIIGAVIWPSNHLNELNVLGVKDSKKFISKKEKILREQIAEELQKGVIEPPIRVIEPSKIDAVLQEKKLHTNGVSSKKYTGENLNSLEIHEMAQLIVHYPCKQVFIDALSTPTYFLQHLKKELQENDILFRLDIADLTEDMMEIAWKDTEGQKLGSTTITAKNKGDQLFPIVSAASIVAKVYRDRKVREIELKHGIPANFLASGYANTQLLPFLEEYRKEIFARQFSFIRYQWDWEPLQRIIKPIEHKMKQKSLIESI